MRLVTPTRALGLYGLLILESGVALSGEMFHLITPVVVASILLHSSTDVLVARWFEDAEHVEPGQRT